VSASDRDDLFQEVFLRVHRAAGPVDAGASLRKADDAEGEVPPEHGSLVPWVMTITVNVARSHFRKAGVRSVVALDDSRRQKDTASSTRAADQELAGRESGRAWIERAVLALPARAA
jgi:DNA-directed RNA polymerase specialized sigma24 family protein